MSKISSQRPSHGMFDARQVGGNPDVDPPMFLFVCLFIYGKNRSERPSHGLFDPRQIAGHSGVDPGQ